LRPNRIHRCFAQLDNAFTNALSEIVLHLPWFVVAHSVTADGKTIPIDKDGLHVPASAHEVRISWRRVGNPHMSYDRTVTSFKEGYRGRWKLFLATGEAPVVADTWRVPE
jgi:hypothetical protein